jgi:hypothetical protein
MFRSGISPQELSLFGSAGAMKPDMNASLFAAAVLASIFLQNSGSHLHLLTAPTEKSPVKLTQVGIAVFDLQLDGGGRFDSEKLLYGETPFIEHSRLSMKQWTFSEPRREGTHVGAMFLYQPKSDLPDARFVFDIPVPEDAPQLQVPFPTRIVDPGHPANLYSGNLVLQLGIDSMGRVGNIEVIQGPPSLSDSAVAALRDWRFYVPPNLDEFARIAIVTIYVQQPELNIGPAEPSRGEPAKLVGGTAAFAPIGSEGFLATDNALELVFDYGSSHWVLPYSLMTTIEYVDSNSGSDSLLKVTFSGPGNKPETITFRLVKASALATASTLSDRADKPIQFKRSE